MVKRVFFFILFITIFIGCNEDDNQEGDNQEDDIQNVQSPSLATTTISNINYNSVTLTGEVILDYGSTVTEKGFCWSTSPNPDINNSSITSGEGLGEFYSDIEGLNSNTLYYIKAYAINEVGIAYSNEQTFTTAEASYMFSFEENSINGILHNKQDKLIYFITFNQDNELISDFKINAFNYDLKQITAQSEMTYFLPPVSGFYNPWFSNNSVGMFNNQMEIYILSRTKLYILNPITLAEITSLTIPDATSFTSVKIKNGLIYLSYLAGFDNVVAVYDREDFTLISEAGNSRTNPYQGNLIVYPDINNENQIICASFPNASSSSIFGEYVFDNQGNYLYSGIGNNASGRIIETNDNVDFILTGSDGIIHQKSNLFIYPPNQSKLRENTYFTDYVMDENGSYIYSIQNDLLINKYNSSTFLLEESIPMVENGRKIVVDEDQVIIIDYDNYTSPLDVNFTFYQN